MTRHLTSEDQERIAAAVAEAETRTSGEIMCVLADEVSEYREVPLAWAAGLALVLPPVAFMLGAQPLTLHEAIGGWSVANTPEVDAQVGVVLTVYAAAQALLFVLAALAASIPNVRRRLTPGFLKDRRVHRAAFQHFLGTGLHLAQGRTGVLIFASVQDRRMEIVADEAIHAKVGKGAWDAVVKDALDEMKVDGPGAGLVKAVQRCGALLAEHFPDDGRPNAYPDRPLQV